MGLKAVKKLLKKAVTKASKKGTKKDSKSGTKKSAVQNPCFAAIDIGSNAIRMVIAEYSPDGLILLKKFRFPIRLGADVFDKGQISAKNLKLSARTFKKFKELSQIYQVNDIRAVGTSALREAKNGKAFLELIRRKSGIKIEIIDGVEEARIIHQAVRREINLENRHALLIDIGGGSVELTFTENGMMSSTQSFPFGTVRTLEMMKKRQLDESRLQLVIGEYLQPLMHFIHSQAPGKAFDFAVGTGGNLETLGKLKPILLNSPNRTMLTFRELGEIIDKLQKTSLKDRIDKMHLRPDRADVILPAALVVHTILRQSGIDKILLPNVGLKDGLIWALANRSLQS
jgi:exopolyphosphatase / guanosine-5'-triphosphate,3'-diphosphate pyrophosphatase